MRFRPRSLRFTLWPIILFVLLLVLPTLACSDSAPQNPPIIKSPASQSQKQADTHQTPLATHSVYSPMVGSGGTPAVVADSHRTGISVSPETVKVGEQVKVTVQAGDLELPICYLYVSESSTADVAFTVGVSNHNEVFSGVSTSHVLTLVSSEWENGQAVFTLRSDRKGTTEVWATLISGGSTSGVADWVSQRVLITVSK